MATFNIHPQAALKSTLGRDGICPPTYNAFDEAEPFQAHFSVKLARSKRLAYKKVRAKRAILMK